MNAMVVRLHGDRIMLHQQPMPRRDVREHLGDALRHPMFWAILGAVAAVLLLISVVREAQ
jgi:hypothetical protein